MISPVLLFGLILVNSVLFVTLGLSAVSVVRKGSTPVLRNLALIVSVVCGVLFAGSLERLALQAVRAGWAPVALREFILGYWDYGQAVAAVTVGLWGIRFTRRVEYPLIRAERVVAVMTDHMPLSVSISELNLTSRELEVVEVMATGLLSDREITTALYIAPVTVGTHVRDILRKADLHNRRELLLIGGLEAERGRDGR